MLEAQALPLSKEERGALLGSLKERLEEVLLRFKKPASLVVVSGEDAERSAGGGGLVLRTPVAAAAGGTADLLSVPVPGGGPLRKSPSAASVASYAGSALPSSGEMVAFADLPPSPQGRQRGVEAVIAERLRQRGGTGALDLFLRHDRERCGRLSLGAFRAALAAAGVVLDAREAEDLLLKYDLDGTGEIHYADFARLADAGAGGMHSEAQASYGGAMIGRRAATAAELEGLERACDASSGPPERRVQQGLEQMRQHLAARQLSLRHAFMRLDAAGHGAVTLEALADGVHALGFPAGLVSRPELLEYAGQVARIDPHQLRYSEFVELLARGRDGGGAADGADADAGLAADPTARGMAAQLRAAKSKLRSGSVRAAFLEADRDRRGLVGARQLADMFAALGVPRVCVSGAAFRDHAAAFSSAGDGTLSYPDFCRMVAGDAAQPPPPQPARRGLRGAYPHDRAPLAGGAREALEQMRGHLFGRGDHVRRVLASHDLDGDGTLCRAAFGRALEDLAFAADERTADAVFRLFRGGAQRGRILVSDVVRAVQGRDRADPPRGALPDHPVRRSQTGLRHAAHLARSAAETQLPFADGDSDGDELSPRAAATAPRARARRPVSRSAGGSSPYRPDTDIFMLNDDPAGGAGREARKVQLPRSSPRGGRDTLLGGPADAAAAAARRPSVSLAHTPPPRRAPWTGDGDAAMRTERRRRQLSPGAWATPFEFDAGAPEPTGSEAAVRALRAAVERDGRKARQVFRSMAKSNGRTLSKRNLLDGLAALGVRVDVPDLHAVFEEHCRSEDGRLSYSDFVRMLGTAK